MSAEKARTAFLRGEGSALEIDREKGLICALHSPLGAYNLADRRGFGGVRYTLKEEETRSLRKALRAEDPAKTYENMHGYLRHYDDSLSRYVWTRACVTWLKDAPPKGLEGAGFSAK